MSTTTSEEQEQKPRKKSQWRDDLREIKGTMWLGAVTGAIVAVPTLVRAGLAAKNDVMLAAIWTATAVIAFLIPPGALFIANRPSKRRR